MRTVLLGDIVATARALMAVPNDLRADLLTSIIDQTHTAHHFHKKMSKPHPKWGDGSLMARANMERQVAEPFASDTDYLKTLQLVLEALIKRWGTTTSD